MLCAENGEERPSWLQWAFCWERRGEISEPNTDRELVEGNLYCVLTGGGWAQQAGAGGLVSEGL